MGQMGPQVLAPEEIITVPSAFITGLKVGGAKSSMEVESGLAYLEMLENGVSEETARALATGVGLANAGLEFLQLDELVKAFKVLDKTGADDALRSTILRELTRRGIDAATEAGQETLQEAVTMGGVQLGSRWDNGHWAYSAEDMGQRLGGTFGDALLAFGLTNVPAAAHNINTSDTPLAAAGEARLLSGEMPSQDQLRAMGMSESEALGHLAVLAMEDAEYSGINQTDADTEAAAFFAADSRDDLASIIKRSTTKTPAGFSCFPDGDPLNKNVQKIPPLAGHYDVALHGSPVAVGFGTTATNMSPRLLASVIRHSEGYHGQSIRLLSCSTGKTMEECYCFAEELANALGVEVIAPNDLLYVSQSGKMVIGDTGAGKFLTFMPNQRRRVK